VATPVGSARVCLLPAVLTPAWWSAVPDGDPPRPARGDRGYGGFWTGIRRQPPSFTGVDDTPGVMSELTGRGAEDVINAWRVVRALATPT
jgi:hypothetical protein